MMLTRLAGLLLPLVLLNGCSGTGDSPSPADKTLRAYFDGIATQTVDSLQAAVGAAQPGSPAAAYATYLEASTRAAMDGGQAIDKARKLADRTSAGFKFCQGSGADHVCFDYTRITQKHGLVADFSINGRPIANRLALGGDQQIQFEGVDATAAFLAAYEATASGELLVVVRITSGAAVTLGKADASYRPPGGAEIPSTMSLGRAKLDPGASASYLFAFSDAKVGGTVTVSASAEGHSGTVVLDIRP